MADNFVEILVKSRDDAKADLDELRAKLDELKSTVATARANVDDAEAAAKLDKMQAKLIDLDHKTASPKIRMSGAIRAEAEIHMLEASLDNLNRKADEAGPKGLLGRILTGAGGAISSAAENIPLLGGIPLPALVPTIAALVPEIVALASGFAAAGAGAGAFGLLAMPAIKHVETAYTDLNTAQQKYQDAQAKYNADPTKGNLKAMENAALGLRLVKDQMDKMPASEQGAIKGVQGLVSEFGKMSKAFEPTAFKVFSDGLKVVNNLLPAVTPFANAFATAIDGLLGNLAKFTASKGFTDWLHQFQQIVGPAVTAIGDGIGKVVIAAGKLLTVFSGKDVAHAINIAFGAAAAVITGVRVAIEWLKTAWDHLSQDPAIKRIVGDIKKAWSDISETGKKKPDFSGLTNAVKDAVSTAITWLNQKLSPLVHTAMQNAANWLKQNSGKILIPVGTALMQGLLDGMKSKIPDLIGLAVKITGLLAKYKGPIEYDRVMLIPHGQAIMDGLMAGMDSRVPALLSQLSGITGAISGSQVPGWGRFSPGGGAGGGPVVQIAAVPGGSGLDAMFMTWLKASVRAQGGDPAIFTRKVAFQ